MYVLSQRTTFRSWFFPSRFSGLAAGIFICLAILPAHLSIFNSVLWDLKVNVVIHKEQMGFEPSLFPRAQYLPNCAGSGVIQCLECSLWGQTSPWCSTKGRVREQMAFCQQGSLCKSQSCVWLFITQSHSMGSWQQLLESYLLKFKFPLCVCVCVRVCMCVRALEYMSVFVCSGPGYMCTYHSTSVEIEAQFSEVSSFPVCVQGIKLKSPGLCEQYFYPWSHFVGFNCEMFKNSSSLCFGVFSPNWNAFLTPFPSRFRDLCRRVCRGGGWLQENSVFQTQQGWRTYDLWQNAQTCTSSSQTEFQRGEEEVSTKSQPNREAIRKW